MQQPYTAPHSAPYYPPTNRITNPSAGGIGPTPSSAGAGGAGGHSHSHSHYAQSRAAIISSARAIVNGPGYGPPPVAQHYTSHPAYAPYAPYAPPLRQSSQQQLLASSGSGPQSARYSGEKIFPTAQPPQQFKQTVTATQQLPTQPAPPAPPAPPQQNNSPPASSGHSPQFQPSPPPALRPAAAQRQPSSNRLVSEPQMQTHTQTQTSEQPLLTRVQISMANPDAPSNAFAADPPASVAVPTPTPAPAPPASTVVVSNEASRRASQRALFKADPKVVAAVLSSVKGDLTAVTDQHIAAATQKVQSDKRKTLSDAASAAAIAAVVSAGSKPGTAGAAASATGTGGSKPTTPQPPPTAPAPQPVATPAPPSVTATNTRAQLRSSQFNAAAAAAALSKIEENRPIAIQSRPGSSATVAAGGDNGSESDETGSGGGPRRSVSRSQMSQAAPSTAGGGGGGGGGGGLQHALSGVREAADETGGGDDGSGGEYDGAEFDPDPDDAAAAQNAVEQQRRSDFAPTNTTRTKTAEKAYLALQFSARDLPSFSALSSTDPYFEIYRYRAYQHNVSALVWEQMRGKLWQLAYKSDHLPKTTKPDWPLVLLKASDICAEELDRPLLIRIMDWNRVSDPTFVGEMILTLRHLLIACVGGPGVSSDADAAIALPLDGTKCTVGGPGGQPNGLKKCGSLIVRQCVEVVKKRASKLSTVLHVPSSKWWWRCGGTIRFKLSATGLDAKDAMGASDPYVEIMRWTAAPSGSGSGGGSGGGQWTLIHTTETIKETLAPSFAAFVLPISTLIGAAGGGSGGGGMRGNTPLLFRVFDWNAASKSELIGQFQSTLKGVLTTSERGGTFEVMHPAKAKLAAEHEEKHARAMDDALRAMGLTVVDAANSGGGTFLVNLKTGQTATPLESAQLTAAVSRAAPPLPNNKPFHSGIATIHALAFITPFDAGVSPFPDPTQAPSTAAGSSRPPSTKPSGAHHSRSRSKSSLHRQGTGIHRRNKSHQN